MGSKVESISLQKKNLPEGYPFIYTAQYQGYPVGRGVDFNEETAILKARMECIERYSCYQELEVPIYWGNVSDFNGLGLGVLPDDKTLRWWCEASPYGLPDKVLLPLEYSQLSSRVTVKDPLVKKTSVGFASHFDKDNAIKNGIAEVIEHRGLKNILQNLGYKETIELSSHFLIFEDIFVENGFQTLIFSDNEFKDYHTCLVMIYDLKDNKTPSLIFGSGCDEDFDVALHKALLEGFGQLVNAIEYFEFGNTTRGFYWDKHNAEKMLANLNVEGKSVTISSDQSGKILDTSSCYVIDHKNALTLEESTEVFQVVFLHQNIHIDLESEIESQLKENDIGV